MGRAGLPRGGVPSPWQGRRHVARPGGRSVGAGLARTCRGAPLRGSRDGPSVATMPTAQPSSYGEQVTWQPATPRLRAGRVVIGWSVAAASVAAAAWLLPGVELERSGAAFMVAAAL